MRAAHIARYALGAVLVTLVGAGSLASPPSFALLLVPLAGVAAAWASVQLESRGRGLAAYPSPRPEKP